MREPLAWPRRWGAAGLAALMIVVCGLYFAALGTTPPNLSIEEVAVAQQALTVAETGRDDSGRWLPLFITERGTDPGGGPHDPLWVYAGAALLKLAPFSEALVRTPSVVTGVLDVLLMFVVAWRIFRDETLAMAAAAMLALTPAHFMHSRIGSQQVAAVPFVLLWLLFLTRYVQNERPRELLYAGLALGVGMYSYIAASVLLPCCLLAMLAALVLTHRGRMASGTPEDVPLARKVGMAAAGFALALLPMIVWHLVFPERLQELLGYYTAHGYNEDLAARGFLSSYWIVTRLDLWWNTLNAERLLFIGDSDFRYSTRQVGHILLPVAVLMAIGIARLHRVLPRELRLVTLLTLLLGPAPAILAGDTAVKRWLGLFPLFVLLATGGAAVLLRAPRLLWRGLLAGLAAAAIVQFVGFVSYYHGAYRADANFYFGGNIHGVVREVLAATDDPACALVDRHVEVPTPWRLYARAAGANEFADRYNTVDAEHPAFAPPPACRRSSLVVLEAVLRDNPEFARRLEAAGWRKTIIPEPEGKTLYAVYRQSAG